jgi:hypothetical protein
MRCKRIKRSYYGWRLVLSSFWRHGSHMRAALLLTLLGAISWAEEAFGVWKLNPARSTLVENQKSVTVRIAPHTRGEVFTLDTMAADGRASTFSTILYFDGKPRDFQDSTCSGTQSSRRVDSRTVEILRECANGGHRHPAISRRAGSADSRNYRATQGRPTLRASPRNGKAIGRRYENNHYRNTSFAIPADGPAE